MAEHWADVENGPSKGKKFIERAATIMDLRREIKPFGESVGGNELGLTVIEKPVYLELGTVDPLEKACRDEVLTLLNNSAAIRVTVPLQKMLQKQRENLKMAPLTQGPSGAAPSTEKKTWAELKRAEKENPTPSATGGRPSPAAQQTGERNVIRVSNLVDEISADELRRIFGEENGLARIQRLYVAKDNKTGGRRGFAYITYRTAAEADKAVAKMHRQPFRNVILLVDYGTPSAGGAGGRGGGMGGGFGGGRGRGGR